MLRRLYHMWSFSGDQQSQAIHTNSVYGPWALVVSKGLEESPSCLWEQCWVESDGILVFMLAMWDQPAPFLSSPFYLAFLSSFFSLSFFSFFLYYNTIFCFFSKVELASFFNQDGLVVRFSPSSPTLGLCVKVKCVVSRSPFECVPSPKGITMFSWCSSHVC